MAPRRIEKIKIKSFEQWQQLRHRDVTASVVAAVTGFHPYETPAGLWHAKTSDEPLKIEDNPAMRRGRRLERVVAEIFLEENPGWTIKKAHVYLRDPKLRLGATPDFFARDPEGRRVIVQAKTVDPWEFKRGWTVEDTDGNPVVRPPLWIILQTLTEAMLSNAHRGIIAALVVDGSLPLHLHEVERHRDAERRIKEDVQKFWASVEAGKEPQFNYERDGALLAAMYPHDDGDELDLRADNRAPAVLEERETVMGQITSLKKRKDALDAELIAKLKDAPSAKINGWRLTFKEQTRAAHVVEESTFRVLRASRQKETT
jgi:predicted phage-related endonuclease